MQNDAPFSLTEPADLTSAAVFSSPHSGADYPQDLLGKSRLDLKRLRASEDVLVDRLFGRAPGAGAPLIAAKWPRAWIDLNRGPGELDPALIEGISTSGLNQRIAAGLGVVPRVVAEGVAIYDGKLTRNEAEARIRDVHAPYHQQLETLLARAHSTFGTALLFDCHSMPHEALGAAPRVRGRTPEIVLGDRFGSSASRAIVALTQDAFERAGFVVARNAPFAGGYITQRYGRPSRAVHAIQIEIDRALYLDSSRMEPSSDFEPLCDRLAEVTVELAAIAGPGTALAAE